MGPKLLLVGAIALAFGIAENGNAAPPDAPLPAGVRAVWDLEKAWREATPTRERVCLNGLWRWQPSSENKAGEVPSANWGFFKVPGAWPGDNSYDKKESQIVHPNAAWKKADV